MCNPDKRTVVIDADGTLGSFLGVIVRSETGIIYEVQCNCTATDQRGVEGFYVPVGGAKYDADAGSVQASELRSAFHSGRKLSFGRLRDIVEDIPYWASRTNQESRSHLQLDETRSAEAVEAWVPVVTPDGPGILVWKNCD
jgi:hypothetical protein